MVEAAEPLRCKSSPELGCVQLGLQTSTTASSLHKGFRPCVYATVMAEAAEPLRCKSSPELGCVQLGLQSSTTASSLHKVSGPVSMQQCRPKLQSLSGVKAVPN